MFAKWSALALLGLAVLGSAQLQVPLIGSAPTALSDRPLRERSAWQALEITSRRELIAHTQQVHSFDTYLLYDDSSKDNRKSHAEWVVALRGPQLLLSASQVVHGKPIDAPLSYVGREGDLVFYSMPVMDVVYPPDSPKHPFHEPAQITISSVAPLALDRSVPRGPGVLFYSADLLDITNAFSEADRGVLQDLVVDISAPGLRARGKRNTDLFGSALDASTETYHFEKAIPGDYYEGATAPIQVLFVAESGKTRLDGSHTCASA